MSQAKDSEGQRHNRQPDDRSEKGQPDARDSELLHAQDLLARTLRFLRHCSEDPLAALAAENPRELIRELEALRAEPQSADEADVEAEDGADQDETEREISSEPRTIPLRRRRSA